jgi:Ribosomal protein S6
MRHYELMIILDPNLEERTVQPSLEGFLKVVTTDGGKVGKLDIWGSVGFPTRSTRSRKASTPSST